MVPVRIKQKYDIANLASLDKILKILNKTLLCAPDVVYALYADRHNAVLTCFFGFFLAFLNDKCVDVFPFSECVSYCLRKVEPYAAAFGRHVFCRLTVFPDMQVGIRPSNPNILFQSSGNAAGGVFHGVAVQVVVEDEHFVIIEIRLAFDIQTTFPESRDEFKLIGSGCGDFCHHVIDSESGSLKLFFAKRILESVGLASDVI